MSAPLMRPASAPGSPPWSRASAPIWAHVSGYATGVRVNKPLAFLRAFADDSASESGDRRLFMAGYLNRAEAWALFAEAWEEELRAAPSIEYLSMAEANNLRDQFDWRKGWTEQKRDEKLRGLARVIRHFSPLSFEFSISRERFYDLVKPVSPRGLGNPHFTCCWAVISTLARYVASEGGRLPIDFIFDQQVGVDDDVSLFFNSMKRSLSKEARKIIRGVPVFEDEKSKQFLPLQAADMLVWHLRREHETCTPPTILPLAALLRADRGHVVAQVDEAIMRRWAAHHRELPGIPQLQSKAQWRFVKAEIGRLSALGIDPSRLGEKKGWVRRAREHIARILLQS